MAQPIKQSIPDLAGALGHSAGDKRIDILRQIAAAGSISEAARRSGVSYKAAWQAIETLGNLAGAPMVQKAVGGAGGGGAQLSEPGRRLLQAADLLHQARQAVLQRFVAGAPTGPGAMALGLRTSMRNQVPCTVRRIQPAAQGMCVALEMADGVPISAHVTRESAQLLGLHAGQPVLALCKATAVRVAARFEPPDVDNLLQGRVVRCSRSLQGGEVSLTLPSGLQWVGFAGAGHGLRQGSVAQAVVDSSAVVVAVPA